MIDAITETAASMRSPMVPVVSFSWGARELVTRGCAALEAVLDAGQVPIWRVAAPPRGHRRRNGAPSPAPEAADPPFVQIPPMALPEGLLGRLDRIRRRYEKAAKSKVSFATLFREAIALGFEAHQRAHREARAILAAQTAALRAAGLPGLLDFVAVRGGVMTPYLPPGPKNPWAAGDDGAAPRSRPPQPTTPSSRSTAKPRGRTSRKKLTP